MNRDREWDFIDAKRREVFTSNNGNSGQRTRYKVS